MAAQASREQRLAVADEVVDNSGDPARLDEQVDALWQRLRAAADRAS
jgi:dephospho-CoA kinase